MVARPVRFALALGIALATLPACGTEDEPLDLWGEIGLGTNNVATDASAYVFVHPGPSPTGYRTPGTCAVGGGFPPFVDIGPIQLRVGDWEGEFSWLGLGGYGNLYVPEGTIEPGVAIEAGGPGTDNVPAFSVTTRFPGLLEGVEIAGTAPAWPAPEITHPLSEPVTATWTPNGSDDWVGLVVDGIRGAVGCSATDADGSITIPVELLEIFEAGDVSSPGLGRCARTSLDVEGARGVLLTACRGAGSVRITFE